jgi:hypothetical protein
MVLFITTAVRTSNPKYNFLTEYDGTAVRFSAGALAGGFHGFPVSPSKCRDNTSIRPQVLRTKPFAIDHSLIILPFDMIHSQDTDRDNQQTTKINTT